MVLHLLGPSSKNIIFRRLEGVRSTTICFPHLFTPQLSQNSRTLEEERTSLRIWFRNHPVYPLAILSLKEPEAERDNSNCQGHSTKLILKLILEPLCFWSLSLKLYQWSLVFISMSLTERGRWIDLRFKTDNPSFNTRATHCSPNVEAYVQCHKQCNPNTAGSRVSKNNSMPLGFSRSRAVASSQWVGIFQFWALSAPVFLILAAHHCSAIRHSRPATGRSCFCQSGQRDCQHWCEVRDCLQIGKSNTSFGQNLHQWKAGFSTTVNPINQFGLYLFNSVVFIVTIYLCRCLKLGYLYVYLEAIIYIPNYLMNWPICHLKRLGSFTGMSLS